MHLPDGQLVDRAAHGDRDAFTEIVRRYQSLLCSIAYGITGRLESSEELAQDAFVAAWKSMDQLREPDRLKQWLSGIVRNLAMNRFRQSSRDVLGQAGAVDHNLQDQKFCDPADQSLAREEFELIDRMLHALPSHYREPLVLFYREQQSVARVAELLDLSPDTIKQRLSRGRDLLRSEVEAILEQGLLSTSPGNSFTMGVLAALPVLSTSAKTATLTVTGAKGLSAMNTAGWMGYAGAVLGPLTGILGGWFGYQMSLRSARSERERNYVRRQSRIMFALIAGFVILLTATGWSHRQLGLSTGQLTALFVTVMFTYAVGLFVMIFQSNRRIAEIRREDGTAAMSDDEANKQLPRFVANLNRRRVFESKTRFLGLPLLSVHFGGGHGLGSGKPGIARGWFAFGDHAWGLLFATGNLAVAPIACGAISIGLISLGGLGIGAVTLGGLAIGVYAAGGLSAGWVAFGGVAVAWHAAVGGLAWAHDIALGGVTSAANMNDDVAKAFLANSVF